MSQYRRLILMVILVFTLAFVSVLPALAVVSQLTVELLPTFPTFNRPVSNCSDLSLIATNTHYEVLEITVSVTGAYQYTDVSFFDGDPLTPDGFLLIYPLGGFDPTSPLTNCLASADDFWVLNLTAGSYTLVVTTFSNGATGPVTFIFDGPGTITIGQPATEEVPSCPIPLPDGSAIYNVPAGAPAFFAPDLASQTDFNLPAGTWWVTQFEGDFAQVWIACQANLIWIPVNAIAR